jgi:DNA helicase-2/ATP-dependent DNA helicase PcrA
MLKAERAALGFPRGFTIYDGADQLGVIREILRDVKVDDRRFDPKAIRTASRAPRTPSSRRGLRRRHDGDYDDITKLCLPRYQAALRALRAVDFDDLITETVRLLERDAGGARALAAASGTCSSTSSRTPTARSSMLVRTLAGSAAT